MVSGFAGLMSSLYLLALVQWSYNQSCTWMVSHVFSYLYFDSCARLLEEFICSHTLWSWVKTFFKWFYLYWDSVIFWKGFWEFRIHFRNSFAPYSFVDGLDFLVFLRALPPSAPGRGGMSPACTDWHGFNDKRSEQLPMSYFLILVQVMYWDIVLRRHGCTYTIFLDLSSLKVGSSCSATKKGFVCVSSLLTVYGCALWMGDSIVLAWLLVGLHCCELSHV